MTDHELHGARRQESCPRVLIADDDASVRELLRVQLSDSFRVVAEAADAAQAIGLADEHQPDIAIVDVQMPAGGAPEAVRGIRAAAPNAAIVVLSADESEPDVRELMQAGALAYVRKGGPIDGLVRILHESLHAQTRLGSGP